MLILLLILVRALPQEQLPELILGGAGGAAGSGSAGRGTNGSPGYTITDLDIVVSNGGGGAGTKNSVANIWAYAGVGGGINNGYGRGSGMYRGEFSDATFGNATNGEPNAGGGGGGGLNPSSPLNGSGGSGVVYLYL